jgi:chromosome condensin MukBEF ATPase and DNA-binding subunit MukB
LHKQRISQYISQSLQARPTKQELLDQGILYKDQMAHQLQARALTLEERLRQRVPENYLTKVGVLLASGDQLAPSIQSNALELEYKMRRRPSLYENSAGLEQIPADPC